LGSGFCVDEAHSIKNPATQRYKHLYKLARQSKYRLLLTGTPLQNNLGELWALLNFLMPNLLSSFATFKRLFSDLSNGQQQEDDEEGDDPSSLAESKLVQRMKGVLSPFLLRRLKSEVSKELSPKQEFVEKCGMAEHQKLKYVDLVQQSKTMWEKYQTARANGGELLLQKETLSTLHDDEENDPSSSSPSSFSRKKKHRSGTMMSNILIQLCKVCFSLWTLSLTLLSHLRSVDVQHTFVVSTSFHGQSGEGDGEGACEGQRTVGELDDGRDSGHFEKLQRFPTSSTLCGIQLLVLSQTH
jgi:SNF2 family DNA or RNA helicase